MTYKEFNAVIMIASAVLIAIWVLFEALVSPVEGVAAIAGRLIWAVVFNIVVNIIAVIAITILVSIARREEFKDERADERDQLITAKSMRNAYFVLSIGGLISLLLMALGFDPAVTAYALFAAMMLAGTTDAASRLVYYRIG